MSIYIGNDLEDRLEALEVENASLTHSLRKSLFSAPPPHVRNPRGAFWREMIV